MALLLSVSCSDIAISDGKTSCDSWSGILAAVIRLSYLSHNCQGQHGLPLT